jgi:thymidine kinase
MSLHIIYGVMYSSKTTKLIETAQKLEKDHKILTIKHHIDQRYFDETGTFITSHDGKKYYAQSFSELKSISANKLQEVEYILIDEAQFFPDLMDFCLEQKKAGKHIYIAGLSKDFNKKTFGQIDLLLAQLNGNDTQEQLFARCECGKDALHSFRKKKVIPVSQRNETIVVGGAELYEPLCDNCYDRKSSEK